MLAFSACIGTIRQMIDAEPEDIRVENVERYTREVGAALGGRTPVKLPKVLEFDAKATDAEINWRFGYNSAIAEVRAALAGRGETEPQ